MAANNTPTGKRLDNLEAATRVSRNRQRITTAAVKGQGTKLNRYAEEQAALKARLEQTAKVNTKRYQRLERLIENRTARLGSAEQAIQDLQGRFEQLGNLTANGTPVSLAAGIVGFTADEIREILSLQQEEEADLTDSVVVTGIVNSIGQLRSTLNTVVDTLAETRGIVNRHEEILGPDGVNLTSLAGRMTSAENSLHETRQSVTTMQTQTQQRDKAQEAGAAVGLVLGVITFIWWSSHHWKGHQVNWNGYWPALIAAIGMFLLCLTIGTLVARSRRNDTTTTTSRWTRRQANQNQQNAAGAHNATQQPPAPAPVPAPTQAQEAPTQQNPAVHAGQ